MIEELDMASITLDLVNYCENDGTFDTSVLHNLVEGLPVTFDEDGLPEDVEDDEVLTAVVIEFTGPYEALVQLVDRYEADPDLRPELITEITNIHD
jgi:hypothetical protein